VPSRVVIHWISVKSAIEAGPDLPTRCPDPAERQLWLVGDGLVVDVHDAGVNAAASAKPRWLSLG